MFEHEERLKKICSPNSQGRVKDLLELWEILTNSKIDASAAAEIERDILNIYGELDFDERQAALQILLKIGRGDYLRGLIFENLGEIWSKFKLLSNQLTGNLCTLESFDGKDINSLDRAPYDLDRTFKDAYVILKKGGSKFI
ncbi:hypothetical protein M4R22_17350 [Acidovorax sp. GBBC 3334]|uniref:hypothetical protein n=1 Tax=Acidovorax sp. GBBC 3334 TaxID=2940496 RepID=UPI002304713E|nr:hypothetical protein [Acidovorax sp. GBBC 3334]MDA8456531.1 hypothetical protein [Acidovorax sp. GBBC 3334]